MKRVIATVGALTLMSVGQAFGAFASYNFENATIGDKTFVGSSVPFTGSMTALGISAINVIDGNGADPDGNVGVVASTVTGFGALHYQPGRLGTLELVFNAAGIDGVSSFTFQYNEAESNTFEVRAFNAAGTQIGTTQIGAQTGANGFATMTLSGIGTIRRITLTDLPTAGFNVTASFPNGSGENFSIDNIEVNTVPSGVPEPSTYAMIGSALAAFALYRRRKA